MFYIVMVLGLFFISTVTVSAVYDYFFFNTPSTDDLEIALWRAHRMVYAVKVRATFEAEDGQVFISRPIALCTLMRRLKDISDTEVCAHIHSSRGFDRGVLLSITAAE